MVRVTVTASSTSRTCSATRQHRCAPLATLLASRGCARRPLEAVLVTGGTRAAYISDWLQM